MERSRNPSGPMIAAGLLVVVGLDGAALHCPSWLLHRRHFRLHGLHDGRHVPAHTLSWALPAELEDTGTRHHHGGRPLSRLLSGKPGCDGAPSVRDERLDRELDLFAHRLTFEPPLPAGRGTCLRRRGLRVVFQGRPSDQASAQCRSRVRLHRRSLRRRSCT